jgi:RNA polymerase sigma-70 factor (ECF subfamily)
MKAKLASVLRPALERLEASGSSQDTSGSEGLRLRLWARLRGGLVADGSWRGGVLRGSWTAQALREGWRWGQAEVFEELYGRHVRSQLGYARRKLGGLEAAEDALQEGWLAAFEKRAELPEGVELERWLFGFVRIAVLRAERRNFLELARRKELPEDELEDPAVDWLSAWIDGEEQARLVTALSSLGTLAQQVLLCSLDGQSPTEIAGELGLTAGNVRVIKHRACQSLRALLEESP